MISLLVAASVALFVSMIVMPAAIQVLRHRSIGQFIQEEVEGHHHKQGTPTMGGVVFVFAAVFAFAVSHVRVWSASGGFQLQVLEFGPGGLLALFALVGMSTIGFIDDFVKYTRKRSAGLSVRGKFAGQLVVAGLFAWGASAAGVSTELSFVRPLGIDLGIFFVVWVLFLLTGAANGANLADGMDGLAAGAGALMFGAYTVVAFWKFRYGGEGGTYIASDPLELATLSAAMLGALLGFLWWNAPPAKIFMGDAGSNGVGGLLAALALLTNTHLLLAIIASLFVAETVSVLLQTASYRLTGNRVFLMAPFHHHFELKGWPETTVVIRFWILAGVGVALGLGLFYADFLSVEGILR
ncbi:MAG: phospho-N-acetylmuramoyl-pentapeptide-transferase [Acidimicrobiia bacterium]